MTHVRPISMAHSLIYMLHTPESNDPYVFKISGPLSIFFHHVIITLLVEIGREWYNAVDQL